MCIYRRKFIPNCINKRVTDKVGGGNRWMASVTGSSPLQVDTIADLDDL